jgi:HNH endonuclease
VAGVHKTGTTCKTTKKYPRVTAGPLRHKYIHRIVAAALIGRELTKDEEVHHRDQDRRNFNWDNLIVLGENDHGWVSAKQAWYMREQDILKKVEWDEFMEAEAARFQTEVALAKSENRPYTVVDGSMRARYEGIAA